MMKQFRRTQDVLQHSKIKLFCYQVALRPRQMHTLTETQHTIRVVSLVDESSVCAKNKDWAQVAA